MGLFSRNVVNESYDSPNSIMNESIETSSIYDGKYDFTMESAYRIVAENDYNYTAIMKAVGINELAAFESNEDFFINEAGGFFTSIVNFLKNIWEKIKGIFRKFIATFDSYTKSDADFIKKYKSYITKSGVLKDFKYKGFKFKIENPELTVNMQIAYDAVNTGIDTQCQFNNDNTFEALIKAAKEIDSTKLEDAKNKISDNWDDDIVPKLRNRVSKYIFGNLDVSDTPDSKELDTALFEYFRSGDSDKITLEESDINVMEIISDLTNSAKIKTDINKAFKKAQEFFDKEIKKVDKISTQSMKAMPGDKIDDKFKGTGGFSDDDDGKKKFKVALDYVNYWSQTTSRLYKEVTNVIVVCQNAWLKAMNDRSRQDKAICVALVNRGTNAKSYGESYSFENEGSSYLGNVKLI